MPRDGRKSNPKGPYKNRRAKRAIKHAEPIAIVDGSLTYIPGIDQRKKTARRARAIAASIMKDMGMKADSMPSWKRQLVARAAMAAIACEAEEAKRQNGDESGDPYVYAAMSRLYQSTLERLGLDARTRPRDYDSDPDDAHEVQTIRRVIVNSTEPVPEAAVMRTNQRT